MKIGGKDLLVQVENKDPKLGSFLRRYIMPAIQSRGLAGHILATPLDAPGDVQLQPISSLVTSTNPKGATYVGTTSGGVLVPAATPISGITELTGDVAAGPGSGSQSATVVGINSAAVPTSEAYVGTNASGQIIAAPAMPLFADSEILGGSGTAWTFVHAPNPVTSVHLYALQYVGGPFVRLPPTAITSIIGMAMVTAASWSAAALMADYRY